MRHLNFWRDFKTFAFKGNLLDLAVAVVLGNAFGAVVTALVKNILMPLISYIMPNSGTYREWHLGKVEIGSFLGELLNFLIISLTMFVIVVKIFGAIQKVITPESKSTPTKQCPYCLSVIPMMAVKCSQCTSDLASGKDALKPLE